MVSKNTPDKAAATITRAYASLSVSPILIAFGVVALFLGERPLFPVLAILVGVVLFASIFVSPRKRDRQ